MSLSTRLRRETADLHQELEDGLDLLDPALTPRRYAWTLSRFLDVYGALECHPLFAAAWARLGLDPEPRRKAAWLRRDMHRLAAALPAGDAPGAPPELGLASEAEALGALYVTEGSTLGGRILVRALEDRAAGAPRLPTRFFQGYGGSTGARWKAFTGALDAARLDRGEADAAVCGARGLFSVLARRTGVASGTPAGA